MPKSLLKPGGLNRFQKIKAIRLKAEAAGAKIYNLGVGEPNGAANVHARVAAAMALLSNNDKVHRYQDNDCHPIPDFARRFVQTNVRTKLSEQSGLACLPLPGIKPVLQMAIEAMGSWQREGGDCLVCTMTNPGYPTPADMCQMVRGVRHMHLPLDPSRGFLFDPETLKILGLKEGDLIMLNLPHNPTGITGNKDWLWHLCAVCVELGVRVWNDAAYAFLTYSPSATTLTDVAVNFPQLSWVEAFSASKGGDDEDGNLTGWRVGALVGSEDFVGDIATIKSNVDSGFCAFSAIGVLDLFESHQADLTKGRELYRTRLGLLNEALVCYGNMKQAVVPEAGFFSLYNCPKRAFGQEIVDAEHFNTLMIENTGVVGVYFDSWIRYAVCAAPVEKIIEEIRRAFIKAEVSY